MAESPRPPELLSPAGSLRHMRYAFAYGADAVYAGLPRYSLRVRNNDFDAATVTQAVGEAHAAGRRFYLATNLMPHGAKVRTFLADMAPLIEVPPEARPDALIMADPGLIAMVRERWPAMPIHLSVQANTVNAAAVRFWAGQGVARVILSRELSIEEIAEIRAACPETELEVFVHGALCIAYSGRCLLSGYFNHRDANQGTCTNACRWEYQLATPAAAGTPTPSLPPGGCGEVQRHPEADEVYLLAEANRPGEYMPVFEDEHGTYIMNAKDLRAVEHVGRLVAMGIDCLKIEGRTKSHYYAARTAQVYRAAIDDARAGRAFRPELLAELDGLANRGYTEGFYRRHAPSELQGYDDGVSRNDRELFVGEVTGVAGGWAEIEVKNRFARGDALTLLTPAGNRSFRLDALIDLDGAPLEVAPGAGWRVRIPLPEGVHAPEGAAFGLLTRHLG